MTGEPKPFHRQEVLRRLVRSDGLRLIQPYPMLQEQCHQIEKPDPVDQSLEICIGCNWPDIGREIQTSES